MEPDGRMGVRVETTDALPDPLLLQGLQVQALARDTPATFRRFTMNALSGLASEAVETNQPAAPYCSARWRLCPRRRVRSDPEGSWGESRRTEVERRLGASV